jgi:hypothetical protein
MRVSKNVGRQKSEELSFQSCQLFSQNQLKPADRNEGIFLSILVYIKIVV